MNDGLKFYILGTKEADDILLKQSDAINKEIYDNLYNELLGYIETIVEYNNKCYCDAFLYLKNMKRFKKLGKENDVNKYYSIVGFFIDQWGKEYIGLANTNGSIEKNVCIRKHKIKTIISTK